MGALASFVRGFGCGSSHCESQLDQHNQQHRDKNSVCPYDWHDVPCVSPEFAHAVLERASLAGVIRMRSSEEVAGVVSFARAASRFAGAISCSLLRGRQEWLAPRRRSLLRRTQQRLAPRHRSDRRQIAGSATSSTRARVSLLQSCERARGAVKCRSQQLQVKCRSQQLQLRPSNLTDAVNAASKQLQRRPHAPLATARVPPYGDLAAIDPSGEVVVEVKFRSSTRCPKRWVSLTG